MRRLAIGLGLGLGSGCTGPPSEEATSIPFSTSAPGETEPGSTGDTDEPVADSTGDPTDGTGDPGTGDSADGSTGDPTTGEPACPAPDPWPAWVTPLQEDLVARLSGAAELTPGVLLSDRASAASRAATVEFVLERWTALGLAPQRHDYSPTGTNVYAVIPAAIPTDQTVVVGAHFDTVPGSPGANDNATGVAMVLSLAQWLDALPCREADVLVVVFDEEELGLLGSQAFAGWLAAQPRDVLSVHTIDQMGWDADGDRALELERADEGLLELYAEAEALAPGDTPLVPTDTGFTDHVSFRALGFAAVGLTEEFVSGDTTPHYHLPSDTFDTVDLDYLASSTALLHVAIGGLVAPATQR